MSKKERDSKGQFQPGNRLAVKHGAYTLKATGKVPSVRGVPQLKKRLARIREDLKGATPTLNVKKELLIEQIVRTEAQISLIEMYLKKAGLLRPDKWRKGIIDLQPALSQSYLAFMNSQRHAIMALGLDEEKAEEILAPYEVLGKDK